MNTIINRMVLVFCLLIMWFLPVSSDADQYHFNNFPVGERPSGMAGAYSALSDDATGLYYNPAGIIRGKDQVTASIYAYTKSTTEYNNVFGNSKFTKNNEEFVPGFFGLTHSLPIGTLGFSFSVVDSNRVNQDQFIYNLIVDGQARWDSGRINYNFENKAYNFGPSYAVPLSEEFSFGTTLYVHYKNQRMDQNQMFVTGGGTNYELLWENVRTEETEWGIRPILGLLWKPKDQKVSVGLSLSRTFLFSRDYTYQYQGTYQRVTPSNSTPGAYATVEKSSDLKEYPYVVTLGTAYTFSPRWLLSWDLSYYTQTSRQDHNTIPSTFPTRSFFNTALGTEFRYSDRWIFRGGFFTNLANININDLPANQKGEAIDMVGGNVSVTFKQKAVYLTLGTSYSTGNGKARLGELGFGSNRFNSLNIDAQSSTWIVFFSASF
jgi:long-chain fatty acid transport protein